MDTVYKCAVAVNRHEISLKVAHMTLYISSKTRRRPTMTMMTIIACVFAAISLLESTNKVNHPMTKLEFLISI